MLPPRAPPGVIAVYGYGSVIKKGSPLLGLPQFPTTRRFRRIGCASSWSMLDRKVGQEFVGRGDEVALRVVGYSPIYAYAPPTGVLYLFPLCPN